MGKGVEGVEVQWDETLADYRAYLQLERQLLPNTLKAYLSDVGMLRAYSVGELGKAPLELSVDDLNGFLHGLDDDLASVSMARLCSSLRSLWQFLIVEHDLDRDITEGLVRYSIVRRLPTVLTEGEVEAMLGAVDRKDYFGVRDYAMVEVLYSCGLRVSELIGLRWSDVYAEDYYLRVVGKGEKERLVPFGDRCVDALSDLRGRAGELSAVPAGDWVFLNRFGRGISRVWVFKLVQRLAALAGLDKEVSPHTFRHSFATVLVNGGADLRLVQAMLGHASLRTTALYTHLSVSDLQAVQREFHPRGRL